MGGSSHTETNTYGGVPGQQVTVTERIREPGPFEDVSPLTAAIKKNQQAATDRKKLADAKNKTAQDALSKKTADENAAKAAEAAKQSDIAAKMKAINDAALARQNEANAGAGTSLYQSEANQQFADSQASEAQAVATPQTAEQAVASGGATNTSPVSSRGVAMVSAPGAKMQATGGMMPSAARSAAPKINQLGPVPQNGMVNSAIPSQELRFGGA